MVAVNQKIDGPVSLAAQHVNLDALEKNWQKQWAEVPASLFYHIQNSRDVVREYIRIEGSSLTGGYEAVRTMVFADNALDLCRSGYEKVQGQDDWGWNRKLPNWKRPEVRIRPPEGESIKYTGKETTVGADSVEWRNSGVLKMDSVLNLDSDAALFDSSNGETRLGGYGQGFKIDLTASVANKQDRINVLLLARDSGKLSSEQAIKAQEAAERIQNSLLAEGESDTFTSVQAQDVDGTYYRIYGYRAPFRSNNLDLWKLKYVVCELDPEQVDPNDLGQVIMAVHHPDREFCRVIDSMPDNLLLLDPYYPSSRSIVRTEEDLTPALETEKIEFATTDAGQFTIERFSHETEGDGAVFFRQVRLLPEENPEMHLIFDYNFKKLDTDAAAKIKRTSNSTYLTGPIARIVSGCVGEMTRPEDWTVILKKYQQITNESINITPQTWPELCPQNKGDTKKDQEKKVIDQAFMAVWPQSIGKFIEKPEDAEVYELFRQEHESIIPLIRGDMAKYLSFNSNIENAGFEIRHNLSQMFNLDSGFCTTKVVNAEFLSNQRSLPEYEALMAEGPLSMEKFINLAFLQGDLFNLAEAGETYYIDAPYGKHVIDVVMKGQESLTHFINDLTYGGYIYPNDRASTTLLLAAIDSGLDVSIEKDTWRRQEAIHFYKTATGEIVVVSGTPQRTTEVDNHCRLRLGGTFDELSRLQVAMDKNLGAKHPQLISARPGNEFQKISDTVQKVISTLKPGETVSSKTLEDVNKMLEMASKNKEDAEKTLKQFKGEIRRRINSGGDINGSQVTGEFPGGGSASLLNEAGFTLGRSSRENRYKSRPRRETSSQNFNSSPNKEKTRGKETLTYKNPDYKITLYDGILPSDAHPLEVYDTLSYHNGEIVQSNRFNDIVLAEAGDGPWRSYNPQREPGYLSRVSDSGINYDGIVEAGNTILPITGETVLPIDALKYDIVYIQLPVGADKQLEPPFLMRDMVNDQFSVVFSNPNKNVAYQNLPAGTRIYIKERKRTDANSDEQRLAINYPDYTKALKETLINESHLDTEAQTLLKYLNKRMPPLSREERMQTIYDFWYKRRLYDKQGIIMNSIEELIQSGVGVCAESEIGMSQMARFVGVPCRTRVCYPDNEHRGQMTPPLHAIIEYISDDGNWHRWDPPNSRMTDSFARQLSQSAAVGSVPVISDASSLGRHQTNKQIRLPADVTEALEKVQLRRGSEMGAVMVGQLSNVLYGKGADPNVIIRDLVDSVEISPEEKKKIPLPSTDQIAAIEAHLSELYYSAIQTAKIHGWSSEYTKAFIKRESQKITNDLVQSIIE